MSYQDPTREEIDAEVAAEAELREQMAREQQETEDERIRRLIDERLSSITGQDVQVEYPPTPEQESIEVNLDDVLDAIDPRDSESALKLFAWLQKNSRLHRAGTLDSVGYIYVYQEPKGSTREGYTAGGTQGDRIVEEALEKAEASGARALKGLCRKCYSAVVQKPGDEHPLAETPRAGQDPAVCADGHPHAFAS